MNVIDFPERQGCAKSKRGDFFAVDRLAWTKACDVGFLAAISYLVLARGAGGDNRTTSWSANAVEQYTMISRSQAKAAIATLEEAALIRRDRGGKSPRYYILPIGEKLEPDWIWLPNALVDGSKDETPPIELLLEACNPVALRLFIELYHAQDLPGCGGLPWREIWQEFDRQKLGERGTYVVWGFSPGQTYAFGTPSFVHLTGKKEKIREGPARDTGWQPFWEALDVLRSLGLVYIVGHVVTDASDKGIMLHPYGGQAGEQLELDLGIAAHEAGLALLPECLHARADSQYLLPAHRHLKDIQIVGVFRLFYRPQTSATALWLANATEWQKRLKQYEKIIESVSCTVTNSSAKS